MLIRITMAIASLAGLPCAFATNYDTTQLSTLGASLSIVGAEFSMNSQAQVLGSTEKLGVGLLSPTIWTDGIPSQVSIHNFGQTTGLDINNVGEITGYTTLLSNQQSYAFTYGPHGVELYQGFNQLNCAAFSINEAGNLAGETMTPISTANLFGFRATDWLNGSPINLGVNALYGSVALAINNQNETVGVCKNNNEEIGFSWSNGKVTYLTNLGSTLATQAVSINNSGLIVGTSAFNSTVSHAVEWNQAGKIKDLGVLAPGGWSEAEAINDNGMVVGAASDSSGDLHAVVFQDGTVVNLNSLLPPSFGYDLTEALSINDNDQIVAEGYDGGNFGVFVLTPDPTAFIIAQIGAVPEPASMGVIFFGMAVANPFFRRLAKK